MVSWAPLGNQYATQRGRRKATTKCLQLTLLFSVVYVYRRGCPPNVPKAFMADNPCDRRSEEHTSELQSRLHLVCRLLLEKKKKKQHRKDKQKNTKKHQKHRHSDSTQGHISVIRLDYT